MTGVVESCGTSGAPGQCSKLTLASGEVQVYLCVPATQTADDQRLAWSVLDAEERELAGTFAFEEDRLHYVVAHGLLRLVLAHYAGRAAVELELVRSLHGRPELATPHGSIRFSLSHTQGMVGCAVTLENSVGFDLEALRRPAPVQLATRYFAGHEVAGLWEIDPDRRDERFFTIWTLKEAYVKARGLGLHLPLDSFAVEPRAAELAELVLRPVDDESPWTLRHWWIGERHAAALALGSSKMQLTVLGPQPLRSLAS